MSRSPRPDNRWNATEEDAFGRDDLGLCVYASRLLGQDASLVLSGGGNSSVKTAGTDVFGDPVDLVWVKGSGWDMGSIERPGFAPLRLEHVARLAELEELSDSQMARELRLASVDPAAPAPSVESILHAILPYRFVLHTHADAVLALTNTPDGEAWLRQAYGDEVVIVPYVMPGFVLAKLCAERFPKKAHAKTIGMALLNHGLFTFSDDAKAAYDNHIELVGRAVDFVAARFARQPSGASRAVAVGQPGPERASTHVDLEAVANLRRDISEAAGRPMIVHTATEDACRRFTTRSDLDRVSQVGTATPDHVLRTKRVPLLGRDVAGYVKSYQAYVERHRHRLGDRELIPVDPAPRVVIDRELGLLTAGPRVKEAFAAAEIYAHTVEVIEAAETLGGYRSVSEADLFDVEYWELEQAKLARQGAPPPLSGEVALVTGAASGIGRVCAQVLLDQGAAVVGLDLDAAVDEVAPGDNAYTGVRGDAGDARVVKEAIAAAVRSYGGVDMVIVNAGIFPSSEPLAELDSGTWADTLRVNTTGGLVLLQAAHPFLAKAPGGGRVVVVASKNVPAPGRGVAAYSVSKAALTQLARVAALEWGGDGIRVNVLHPDAVFDTGLWNEELIAERAAAYGLTTEEYRRRNVLGAEVSSAQVAEAAVTLCGPTFARTTGAQIPIDGGNDRVI